MARRVAAASAFLAFGVAVLLGLGAQNTFATTVGRALVAMGGTFVIGLIVGAMGDKMAKENLKVTGKTGENPAPPGGSGR